MYNPENRHDLVTNVQTSLDRVETYQNEAPKVDWEKYHFAHKQHMENLTALSNSVNELLAAINTHEDPAFDKFNEDGHARVETASEMEAKRDHPEAKAGNGKPTGVDWMHPGGVQKDPKHAAAVTAGKKAASKE